MSGAARYSWHRGAPPRPSGVSHTERRRGSMDVLTLARILLRRWYVVLPLLALAGAGAFLLYQRGSPVYSTSASLLFADPSMQSAEERGGQDATAAGVASPRVIAAVMQDSEVQQQILDGGGSPDYDVALGEDGVISVRAQAEDDSVAVRTVELVLDEVGAQMHQRQEEAGVPEDDRLAVEVLSSPGTARPSEEDEGEVLEYEASGTLQVLGDFGEGNPYAEPGFTFGVLREVATSDRRMLELREQVEGLTFNIDGEEAPIMRLSVSAEDPREVGEAYELVSAELSEELERRQEDIGVPAGNRMRLQELTEPGMVQEETDGLVRPLVTVAGLGVVVAVAMALLVDNVATALSRRRSHESWTTARTPATREPEPTGADRPSDAGDRPGHVPDSDTDSLEPASSRSTVPSNSHRN
ncbi:hypothetical protein ER308_12345 [Egibacter rhizosphaerae]|uniref:Polysaccharide chain length determinant N-terminal domain-containing protein n=1 Tax=Egibacter rhizosphaerae TaxID=1670831 RepID=A0A411YGH7_9ACTN|nr:hypothetical protein [Egibacter rhizosphaerae]QBI20279.1 hypothetical protein ER308_12345 [Egibacter rhizosphaerae]